MIIILACLLVICILFLLYMYIEAHRNIVLTHLVEVQGLPGSFNGYKLYFISDVHRRTVSKRMLRRLDKPDIVVIGGDLTEKDVPFSKVEENLRRLEKIGVPMLFVWGNHDIHVDRHVFVNLLNKYRVKRLENQVYTIYRNNDTLNILGVSDATNYLDRLDDAINRCEPGCRLLISHNPIIAKKIESHHHIPLVISGHTHGGQIRLFGWGLREAGGIKSWPFGKLVISCGYGTTRFPLRLGAHPDTLLIQLKSETNHQ